MSDLSDFGSDSEGEPSWLNSSSSEEERPQQRRRGPGFEHRFVQSCPPPNAREKAVAVANVFMKGPGSHECNRNGNFFCSHHSYRNANQEDFTEVLLPAT